VTVKEVLKELLFQTLLSSTFRRFSDSIRLQRVPTESKSNGFPFDAKIRPNSLSLFSI